MKEGNLLFAAFLINPSRDFKVKEDIKGKVNMEEVLSILRQNKVHLLFLPEPTRARLPLNEFKKFYEKERTFYERWIEEYQRVVESFLEKGIQHVLLKSDGDFPYLDDNLDILIKEENSVKTKEILRNLGYIEVITSREPYKYLFIRFLSEGEFFDIHLHEKIAWHVPFLETSSVWQRKRKIKDEKSFFYILSPEDRVLLNIAHIIYENHLITLPEIIEISNYLSKSELNWKYVKDTAIRKGWIDGLYWGVFVVSRLEEKIYGNRLVKANVSKEAEERCDKLLQSWLNRRLNKKLEIPFRFNSLICRILYTKKILTDPDVSLTRRIKDWVKVAYKSIRNKLPRRHRPFLITFSGIDGSGKTTCATALVDAFQACCIDVHYFWNRIECPIVVRFFSRIGKSIFFKKMIDKISMNENYSENKIHLLAQNPFIRFLWVYSNMVGLSIEYFFYVQIPLFLGKVIICDRYIYDAIIDIWSFLPEGRISRKLVAKLLPILNLKPDMAFLCDVPVHIAVKRGRQTQSSCSVTFLSTRKNLYQQMVAKKELITIDTGSNRQEVVENKIIFDTVRRYFEYAKK